MAGDFFQGVPEGDVYLLKQVLHDWNDDSCLKILRNCHDVADGHEQEDRHNSGPGQGSHGLTTGCERSTTGSAPSSAPA